MSTITDYRNMRIKDLKNIINDLSDDMPVVIPVIDQDDVNRIYGFRMVRTAGILTDDYEKESKVLCLNGSADGEDIADQIYHSGRDVGVETILMGMWADTSEEDEDGQS